MGIRVLDLAKITTIFSDWWRMIIELRKGIII